MKNADICQARWCRQRYAFTLYRRGEPWRWRLCEEHAERYISDLRYIVEKRPQPEAARGEVNYAVREK